MSEPDEAEDTNTACGSPPENYDPLADDYTAAGYLADPESYHGYQDTEDSLGNSLNLDQEISDPYRYGITPPSNQRALKRAKEKSRSHKFSNKAEMREIMSQIKHENSPMSGPVVTASRPDRMYLGTSMGEPSSDDSKTDSTSPRKRRQSGSKGYKMTRRLDRDFKSQSGAGPMSTSIPKNVMQVDSPNHFKSLDTTQIGGSTMPLSGPQDIIPSIGLVSSSGFPCTKVRMDFIRTFNMLIRMGNKAMKDRESRAAQYNRQLSTELQAKYSDIIWLELRAYLNRRKVSEQDDLQYRLQLQVPRVLREIVTFRVNPAQESARDTQMSDRQSTVIEEHEEERGAEQVLFPVELNATDLLTPYCDRKAPSAKRRTPSVLSFCQGICDTSDDQEMALLQVASLLDKLERVETLYPTYKSFGMAHAQYNEPGFQHRLRTLYLWLNLTVEMGNKLHHIAKMLQIDTIGVEWPWLKYNPRYFLHERGRGNSENLICMSQPSGDGSETEEDSDEEYDSSEYETEDSEEECGEDDCQTPSRLKDVHLKNVRFNISDSNSSAPQSPEAEHPPGSDNNKDNLFLVPTDTSTPSRPAPPSRNSSILSVSRSSSNMSFEESTRTAIYRNYADRMLKRTGVTKLKTRLKDLLEGTLQRVKGALEKPKVSVSQSYASVASVELHLQRTTPDVHILSSSPSMDGTRRFAPSQEDPDDSSTSLSSHGLWSPSFRMMALPSFRPTYLFLVRIPLDVIHECLRLRLEQRPRKDPSSYSIRHLIKECKEILEAATNIKLYYLQMVGAVFPDEEMENLDLDMDQFEDDMEKMLDGYLDYLRLYMSELQHNNMSHISKQLKDFLEDQWKFAKVVIPHVRGGEANAARRFCIMATSLLQSISIFLDMGMDDCINELYDISSAGVDDEGSEAEAEAKGSLERIQESESEGDVSDIDARHLAKRNSRSTEVRKGIFKTCRKFKELFNEARERIAKALSFAKMLRKDLEIAAEYNIKVPINTLFRKLRETGHFRVLAQQSAGYVIFVPGNIISDHSQILQLLNVTCGREDLLYNGRDMQHSSKAEGYMLVVRCECRDTFWEGETMNLESSAELTIALSHLEVESLLLVVLHSSQLAVQRKDFELRMLKAVQLAKEQISCHTVIAESIQELKTEAMCLREKVDHAIQMVEEKLDMEDITEMDDTEITHKIQTLYRETLLRCYNFGCEYHEELLRLVSIDMRATLYPHLVAQAERWMMFAINKCEKGRGRRPKWAHTGLNFLTVAINPESVAGQNEERFMEIKDLINKCIHHVIGERNTFVGAMSRSDSQERGTRHPYNRIQSCPESQHHVTVRSQSTRSIQSEPATPHPTMSSNDIPGITKSQSVIETAYDEESDTPVVFTLTSADNSPKSQGQDPFSNGLISQNLEDEFPRLAKMYTAAQNLERIRRRKLHEKKFIGRRTRKDQAVDLSSLVNVRPVRFRWTRTTKIGEGRYGKVYTAVNTNTGELMAMKEMKFQSNDIQYIRKIIDEIRNLENISGHPRLVQYYGVEVHSDEIYIFMEYCPGGTLADAAKAGLPEDMVRKYTSELLGAVNVLHEHNIVHRDIKGPNIFLTVDGPLKLGDLGCAVQLKNHSTMPGEVKGMEGTAAYMAPEVFTNHEGGRMSDIWSLGCTVIEMVTGKRPWPELENQFQIMYKVGMGESPTIPPNLSEEGQDFIRQCLQHEPKLRWTASKLQEHSFVKIYSSDDENEKT